MSAATIGAMVGLVGASIPSEAQASPLRYSFTGTVSGGSGLDLGSGMIDLTGASFTVSGITMDDTDVMANDMVGLFASTSTYDFGSYGAFITDSGSDYFLQAASSASSGIDYIGLVQNTPGQFGFPGFQLRVANVAADPNTLNPLGPLTPLSTIDQSTRRLSNAAGQSLLLAFSFTPMKITSATVEPVPEPATIGLVGLGMAGVAAFRRRRSHRASGVSPRLTDELTK